MSSFDYDEDQHDNEPDFVKRLRKNGREQDKSLKELREQLSGFQKEARVRTVSSVLEARGVNPKVAGFIPADIDASAEAVGKWLDEYGDVFGATAPTTATDSTAKEEKPAENDTNALDNDLMATLIKIQGADSGAGAVNLDAETQAVAALASIGANAKSSTDFFNSLRSAQR